MLKQAIVVIVLAALAYALFAPAPAIELAPSLKGQVAIVTGASRGIGKGIAIGLGEHGATVYITGRTLETTDSATQVGTLIDTCKLVEAAGGKCVPVKCDNGKDEELEALFTKVVAEEGKIDILVNNAFSAVNVLPKMMGKPFWEKGSGPGEMWDHVNGVGLRSHYVASVLAARHMSPKQKGLVINISSFGALNYIFDVAYGIGKCAMDRMANDMAIELATESVNMVSFWPGLVKTENVEGGALDSSLMTPHRGSRPGQPDMDLRDLLKTPLSETPLFTGRAIAMFARDAAYQNQVTGKVLVTADIAHRYDVKDERGVRTPSFLSLKFLLGAALKPVLQQFEAWELPDYNGTETNLPWAADFFWNKLPQLALPKALIKLDAAQPNF
jgi:NAD(P)-dependent dehydrogenase (short-subunit alcohol dehydrogenase family)